MEAADRELFIQLGLEGALKQIEQNPALGVATKQVLAASGLAPNGEGLKAYGNMLYSIAASLTDARAHRRDVIAKMIGSGALVTAAQVNAAIDFFKKKTPDATYSDADLAKACGAGIKFTDEQVSAKVRRPWFGGGRQAVLARCAVRRWNAGGMHFESSGIRLMVQQLSLGTGGVRSCESSGR